MIILERKSEKAKKLERKFEVPDTIQAMLRKKSVRERLPKNCFLLPDERKFPICNPLTKKIDCRLVKAAMSRAAGFNKAKKKYPSVFRKAQEIYNKRCRTKTESVMVTKDALIESLFIEFIANPIIQDIYQCMSVQELLSEFDLYVKHELPISEQTEIQDVRDFPKYLEQWLKDRDKIPADYFLIPEEKKFPVKGPDGKYDCRLILRARIRAKQFNYPSVLKKANELWERYCKEK